jgi:predicted tellurium resistance membrane protein TerC
MLCSGILCLEVLLTIIIVWIGVAGLVAEALEHIDSKKIRCSVYSLLLGLGLLAGGLQNQVTVCGLHSDLKTQAQTATPGDALDVHSN